MIDHVLGRPSVKFRKYQVFAVVSFWSLYLQRGDRHGPPLLRRLSKFISRRLTVWQTVVITLIWLYVSRNFGKLVGLECPEPLANLYNRSYFRATWVTTALDAGFWSAMHIRQKWLRDICSVVFSLYYLICAEQADDKVRKVRGTLTVDHLRVSWNKGTTPYLSFSNNLLRPRLIKYPPRAIRIPRPSESSYSEPVSGWLYFDGPLSALKRHSKLILDVPGGGFVAMTPRNHDDKLLGWAAKTGLPVLSLDYRKAPEYPYPYALNECYDVYHTLISSRGRCVGLLGDVEPKIIVSGDSAGGNLAVGMVMMILQSGSTDTRRWQGERSLPPPSGVVLIYPALDMNIGNWMSDEQMALIKDRRVRKTNQGILRRKSEDYRNLTPDTPHHSDDENDEDETDLQTRTPSRRSTPADSSATITSPSTAIHLPVTPVGIDTAAIAAAEAQSQTLKTRLAMSSMISYFNDRILTPEMMRAMIILYIGPHNRPDFSTEYLLSPVLAPESILAKFPKTYFLTGERDPLVDDTVIFAGRLRQAKAALFLERKELGLVNGREEFNEAEHVEVMLIPGISHGFLQFVSVFPEGWRYIYRCSKWMKDIFELVDREQLANQDAAKINGSGAASYRQSRNYSRRESSGDEDRPLEMTLGRPRGGSKGTTAAATSPRAEPSRGRARVRKTTTKRRRKSLVSLASSDDLLGRRMKGLAGSLLGVTEDDDPPTP